MYRPDKSNSTGGLGIKLISTVVVRPATTKELVEHIAGRLDQLGYKVVTCSCASTWFCNHLRFYLLGFTRAYIGPSFTHTSRFVQCQEAALWTSDDRLFVFPCKTTYHISPGATQSKPHFYIDFLPAFGLRAFETLPLPPSNPVEELKVLASELEGTLVARANSYTG